MAPTPNPSSGGIGRNYKPPKPKLKKVANPSRGGIGRYYKAPKKPKKPAPGPGVYTPGPGVVPAAGPPAAAGPNTYPEYAGQPWAQQQLMGIDTAEKSHEAYVSGTVAPWLSSALAGLTGVDPAHPGINPTLQQQYLANVQGVVGGALNAAAAGAQGPAVTPTTPGGIAASPTSYLTGAAAQGDYGRASGMLQSAQMQSALNTQQPNTEAQGFVYQLAALQAGLPAVYAQKRADARVKIDQFISTMQQEQAKADEVARHNHVTEAISATNATTNAAYQAANLGLRSTTAATSGTTSATNAATSQARAAEVARHNAATEAAAAATTTGGAPGGTKPLTQSQISSMNGRWKGSPTKPPKLGKEWKQPVYDTGTGLWYAKRAAGGGTTTKPVVPVKDTQTIITGLTKAYAPPSSGTGTSIATRNAGNPKGAATEVVRYILDRRNSFTSAGGKVNQSKLLQVLRAAVGGPDPTKSHGGVQWHVLDILQRGYMTPQGTWKGSQQNEQSTSAPVFTEEGPKNYAKAYQLFSPFAKPGTYKTTLTADREKLFRQWVADNKIPFNPNAAVTDYDMRGFWKANGAPSAPGTWKAGTHFPDTWKTPYDTTFSAESRYATKNNPFKWKGNKLVDTRTGKVIFAGGG